MQQNEKPRENYHKPGEMMIELAFLLIGEKLRCYSRIILSR
jgi:hypothetical protein